MICTVAAAEQIACYDIIAPIDDKDAGNPGDDIISVWENDAGVVDGSANPLGAATYSNAQVCGVLDAANKAAVATGQLAPTRAQSPLARALAARIVTERGVAMMRDTALYAKLGITPAASPTSLKIAKDMDSAAAALRSLAGAAFDAEYLSAEVTAHAELLGLIEYSLIPSAQNGTLVAELENTRAMVANQLAALLKLQAPAAASRDDAAVRDASASGG